MSEKEDSNLELPSQMLGCSSSSTSNSTEFTFETDHEALRSNPDYLALLKTLSVLQSQKIQAVHDLDQLNEFKEEALKDPLKLLRKIKNEGEKGLEFLPKRQKIAEIPDIEWEKYEIPVHSSMGVVNKRPETRNNANKEQQQHEQQQQQNEPEKKQRSASQPWTNEEQRRLEELLLQFPSEDVEMERWKKIAKALGNRTAIQVQSRTQKYFLKLQKAGLPIPGRQLKGSKPGGSGGGNPSFNTRSRRSTFFPEFNPAVKMDDEDDDGDQFDLGLASCGHNRRRLLNDGYYIEEEDVSDEEGVSDFVKKTDMYKELIWLKRIRREKEVNLNNPTIHTGFKCDGCAAEPISGGRFQCMQCENVDFCLECAPKGIRIGNKHTKEHSLKPVRRRQNYLDPNPK